eukprot:3932294-Karenia_brevis.AAC.1
MTWQALGVLPEDRAPATPQAGNLPDDASDDENTPNMAEEQPLGVELPDLEPDALSSSDCEHVPEVDHIPDDEHHSTDSEAEADAVAQKELLAVLAEAPNLPTSDDESVADEGLTAGETAGEDVGTAHGSTNNIGSASADEQEIEVDADGDEAEELQYTVPTPKTDSVFASQPPKRRRTLWANATCKGICIRSHWADTGRRLR